MADKKVTPQQMTLWAEKLNYAGMIPTYLDAQLGAATERLAVGDSAQAQAHITAAHNRLAQLGLALEDVAVLRREVASGPDCVGGPVTPPTPTPTPPPVPGNAFDRYNAAPSNHSKILFLTDAEASALIQIGKATEQQLNTLRGWYYYQGLKMGITGSGASAVYRYSMPGSTVGKVDGVDGNPDVDCPNQPVPRAP